MTTRGRSVNGFAFAMTFAFNTLVFVLVLWIVLGFLKEFRHEKPDNALGSPAESVSAQ